MGKIISQGDNKRIAKNTLMLYFRMFITMAVGLYTSRIVLAILGVQDYGIYNVVGGFVSMFSVISGTMTTATQRFLSFEIGKKENGNVRNLFATSVMIHIFLGLIILIVAETFGLWFLNTKMTIPQDRLHAANWVFQLSILTFIVSVISVPYNAALIAYEKMAAFAYVSIVEVVLKLVLVLILGYITYDKLILYAIILAGISIVLRIIYGVYVKKHFLECRCDWKLDKTFFNKLLSFISWNFIGSIAGIFKEQGLNIVLNMFFGATVNAARGIAYQVLNAVSGFVSNFQLALNPQIVKHYAANQREDMFKLVFRGSKFSFLLMMILSIPIFVEAHYILNIWLVEVPEYSVVFLRLVLLITLVDSLSYTLITSVHASGKVKWYQIINGSVLLLTLPIVYIALYMGMKPYMAMVISLIMSIVCLFVRLAIVNKTINFPMKKYIMNVVLVVFITAFLAFIPIWFLSRFISENFISFVLISGSSLLVSIVVSFFFALSSLERSYILQVFLQKVRKKYV